MLRDPIVEEVRKAGEELAKLANYDIHTFFENLRMSETKYKEKLITKIRNPEIINLKLENQKV